MALNLQGCIDAVRSHAEASGWVERTDGHEPKNAPGHGISMAVWWGRLSAVPRRSGLAATSSRIAVNVRLALPMLHEPQDDIDPLLSGATDALFRAYHADRTLGGLVDDIDLLGAYGDPLEAVPGYLNQDNTIYRVSVITLPLIVNDLWVQS